MKDQVSVKFYLNIIELDFVEYRFVTIEMFSLTGWLSWYNCLL